MNQVINLYLAFYIIYIPLQNQEGFIYFSKYVSSGLFMNEQNCSSYRELQILGWASSPQNRILGLYKLSPPARTNQKSTGALVRVLQPMQARSFSEDFVCVAAVSTARCKIGVGSHHCTLYLLCFLVQFVNFFMASPLWNRKKNAINSCNAGCEEKLRCQEC